jgi:signal transduction histidine kinase
MAARAQLADHRVRNVALVISSYNNSHLFRLLHQPVPVAYSERPNWGCGTPSHRTPMANSQHAWSRAPTRAKAASLRRIRLDASSRAALTVWLPVAVLGAVGLILAVASLATSELGWEESVGIALLIAAATVAEAFPVPIEGVAVGSMSLATIFLVAGATIYGWAAAAVAGFLAMAFVEFGRRRPFSRIAFNSGMYILAGMAAGGAAAAVQNGTLLRLALSAIAAAVAFWVVDIALLTLVITRSRSAAFLATLRNYAQLTFVPFAVMASLAVILVVLWDRSPFVAVILVGPLVATALYQRWIHGALSRLREFDRLKDEFIAIVSHELRTPLTSVYGAAMTLEQQNLDEERQRALLEIISTEAARLSRLLDDILWVSRLDSGRVRPYITQVEPLPLAADVVDATRTHLPPDLSLHLLHDDSTPDIAADPDKLRQVLVNLVENAVKYSREGRIEVRLHRENGNVRFSVRDEGPGIPPSQHERIFEKFYRLDPNMTQGVGGTGLGLYICRELVESMDGEIWVESAPGGGATFSFELPVAS